MVDWPAARRVSCRLAPAAQPAGSLQHPNANAFGKESGVTYNTSQRA